MPTRITCPCGRVVIVRDDHKAEVVQCPNCKEPLRLQSASSPPASPASSTKPASPAKQPAKPAQSEGKVTSAKARLSAQQVANTTEGPTSSSSATQARSSSKHEKPAQPKQGSGKRKGKKKPPSIRAKAIPEPTPSKPQPQRVAARPPAKQPGPTNQSGPTKSGPAPKPATKAPTPKPPPARTKPPAVAKTAAASQGHAQSPAPTIPVVPAVAAPTSPTRTGTVPVTAVPVTARPAIAPPVVPATRPAQAAPAQGPPPAAANQRARFATDVVAITGEDEEEAYVVDRSKRATSYWVSLGIFSLALFSLLPAIVQLAQVAQSKEGLVTPRWVYLLFLAAVIHCAYAVYLAQLPDWSTAWVVTLATLVTGTFYAMMLAVCMLSSESNGFLSALQLSREAFSQRQQIGWCLIMLLANILLGYVAGRFAIRWKHALQRACL